LFSQIEKCNNWITQFRRTFLLNSFTNAIKSGAMHSSLQLPAFQLTTGQNEQHFLHERYLRLSLFICSTLKANASETYYTYISVYTIHIYIYYIHIYILYIYIWHNNPTRATAASLFRFLDHTNWHNTVDRTPLKKKLAPSINLYMATPNTDNHAPGGIQTRNPCKQSTTSPRLILSAIGMSHFL
jgi:hypothetical protein